jgi:predicted acylesterase/phospholipase RssA
MTGDTADVAGRANGGSASTTSRFQILALDGGGARGLFSAHVLAHLECDLGIKITDTFDLITGTSTGGIIALALGAGLTPAEIAAHYVELTAAVFPKSRRRPWRLPAQLLWPKYRSAPLKRALQGILGDRLLGSSETRLVIPAYDVQADAVHIFKTPHHPRLRRDWKYAMVDVALATSAAPTYLPVAKVGPHRLIDGGVWANNPSVVGIAEAVSMLGVQLDQIKLLNVGTTSEITSQPKSLDNAGIARWAKPAAQMIVGASSRGAQGLAEHLLTTSRFSRLDALVPRDLYSLDHADSEELAGWAATASRNFSPVFSERFADHRAAPYKPLLPGAGECE